MPFFTSETVPDPFWITPEKVVEVLLAPVLSVAAVVLLSVTVPAPAREPMPLPYPPRSSVAPLPTVTAELAPKADVLPACSVPALTVVVPV